MFAYFISEWFVLYSIQKSKINIELFVEQFWEDFTIVMILISARNFNKMPNFLSTLISIRQWNVSFSSSFWCNQCQKIFQHSLRLCANNSKCLYKFNLLNKNVSHINFLFSVSRANQLTIYTIYPYCYFLCNVLLFEILFTWIWIMIYNHHCW